MASQPHHQLTLQQYVALTRNVRDVKLEFFDGTVWAMAGGSPRHSALALATGALLFASLRGGPCRPFNSDQAVATPDGLYTYPDGSVVCGPISLAAGTDHATNPVVLVEVLSESTRDYDEGEKLDRYKKISTARDILHVDQDTMRVVHYTRDDAGAWSSSRYADPDEVIALCGVDAKLRVGDIYEGAFDLPA
jgi:Uma2 family endonuclease